MSELLDAGDHYSAAELGVFGYEYLEQELDGIEADLNRLELESRQDERSTRLRADNAADELLDRLADLYGPIYAERDPDLLRRLGTLDARTFAVIHRLTPIGPHELPGVQVQPEEQSFSVRLPSRPLILLVRDLHARLRRAVAAGASREDQIALVESAMDEMSRGVIALGVLALEPLRGGPARAQRLLRRVEAEISALRRAEWRVPGHLPRGHPQRAAAEEIDPVRRLGLVRARIRAALGRLALRMLGPARRHIQVHIPPTLPISELGPEDREHRPAALRDPSRGPLHPHSPPRHRLPLAQREPAVV